MSNDTWWSRSRWAIRRKARARGLLGVLKDTSEDIRNDTSKDKVDSTKRRKVEILAAAKCRPDWKDIQTTGEGLSCVDPGVLRWAVVEIRSDIELINQDRVVWGHLLTMLTLSSSFWAIGSMGEDGSQVRLLVVLGVLVVIMGFGVYGLRRSHRVAELVAWLALLEEFSNPDSALSADHFSQQME